MSMDSGNMATELIDELEVQLGISLTAQQRTDVTPLFTAIANVVVGHIQANAVVTVPVDPGDAALQTSTALGTPTGGPAAPTSLDGTIT